MNEPALRLFSWMNRRLRPAEGWLPLILLLAAVYSLVISMQVVEWVPEDTVIAPVALLGLLLSILLAKRPIRPLPAWLLLLTYGLLLSAIYLADAWPPLRTLQQGWPAISQYLRQNLALFYDRAAGWLIAVSRGGTSRETVVFGFGLGIGVWLLAAFAGWSTFRQRRPLAGLTTMGFALAVNSHFGRGPLWPVALFIGVAALLASVIHFTDLEKQWLAKQVDFSEEIRPELLVYSGGIATALLALALIIPAVNIQAISEAFQRQPAVQQAEESLERVFAGVEVPQGLSTPTPIAGSGPVGRSSLPRSFLLGNAPQLYETVVFTATVRGSQPNITHWRENSYDRYNGRGWSISDERREPLDANEEVPLPAVESSALVEQNLHWVAGSGLPRLSLGLPLRFDHEVLTYWRGIDDLSRVQAGRRGQYVAVSRVSAASAAELRRASLSDVPGAILARYTELPDDTSDRVLDLAQDVAGGQPTPYDQALALQQFLRQYPYSLEIELPPGLTDPVDYFLFELQSGYCDYYASAMVVMARSLGLPARFTAGYLAQPADEQGVQTVYQINSHSWAEIYFAGYGWIEFEPTAPFPSEGAGGLGLDQSELQATPLAPPPIPESEGVGVSPLWGLLLLVLLGGGWVWLLRRQMRLARLDAPRRAYFRLQENARRLGQDTPLSQTPSEFSAAFNSRLSAAGRRLGKSRLGRYLALPRLQNEVDQLSQAYMARQYSRRSDEDDNSTWQKWLAVQGRFRLLRLWQRIRSPKEIKD